VRTRFLRELPVAAASGIVRVGRTLFVVADDDNRLAAVPLDGGAARLLPFADQPRAADHGERKRTKRDVEALTIAGGALIGIGSGSTPGRRFGFAWEVDAEGALAGQPLQLDLAPLYGTLAREIPDLNVEGATFVRDRLLLFQRGNGPAGVNAVIALRWTGDPRTTLVPEAIEAVERHDLGTVGGVRLGFTDATCAGEAVVFTAVAEAAESTYEDGPLVGAAVGLLGGAMAHLDPPLKVEGVEVAAVAPDAIELLMVVDDDDPSTSAQLVAARLPR
jgi:hypothetical protein